MERAAIKIKSFMGRRESAVTSAASVNLALQERLDLGAIAAALPDDWVVQLEPPYGQLSIGPAANRVRYTRCWIGIPALRVLRREPWRSVL